LPLRLDGSSRRLNHPDDKSCDEVDDMADAGAPHSTATAASDHDDSRHRLAAIVDSSEDAIVGKTLQGIITSWNAAAERLFGYSTDEAIGQSVLMLIPEDRRHEETEILARLSRGQRIEHFQTVRRRKDGTLIDIALTISPIRREDGTIIGASKIARDITAQTRAEALLKQQTQRLQTLNQVARLVAQDLDFERIVGTVTDVATDIAGAQFGAFFYNVTDARGDSLQLFKLAGVPRERFEVFGMPRATHVFAPTFRGEATIVSDDIRVDPRYGRNAPHAGIPQGHLPVVSYLAVPVRLPSGEVLGGLFFGHDQPGRFDAETARLIEGIAAHAAVAMDNARLHLAAREEIEQRKAAEHEKELLLHELKHRVKNTLATIQALAANTFRDAPADEKAAFAARVQALAAAHDLLTAHDWGELTVEAVIARAIRPFQDDVAPRFVVEAVDARITAPQALALSLSLHELATNAAKYGALSVPEGRVELSGYRGEDASGRWVEVCWRESGGPRVETPPERGFGTKMIERALSGGQGDSALHFHPEGLVCRLRLGLPADG
jgi:PAS domain S-box-containing protein